MMSCIAESDQGQIRGCVIVTNNTGENHLTNPQDAATSLVKYVSSMPCRLDCLHYVFDDHRIGTIIKESMQGADDRMKVRIKPYFGTFEENKLALLSVGIPVAVMPVQASGKFDLTYHQEWIKERVARESLSLLEESHEASEEVGGDNDDNGIDSSSEDEDDNDGEESSTATMTGQAPVGMYPGPLDVIVGKSSVNRYHSGNIRYESVLDDYEEEYEAANKTAKTKLAEKIVNQVLVGNGRFIKKSEAGWVETTFLEARNKVSMAYRDRRRKRQSARPKNENANASSSS